VDELAQCHELEAEKVLFIISWEACARSSNADAPMSEVRLLRDTYPDACLIILSDTCDADDVVAAIRAGANGYLMSSLTCDALTKSFDLVMSGETVLPSKFTRALCDRKSPMLKIAAPAAPTDRMNGLLAIDPVQRVNGVAETCRLSKRETTILSRLILGDSNKTIARGIGVAEATVKTHIKTILRKVGAKNRTQAALWAFTNLGQVVNLERPLQASPNKMPQNGQLTERGSEHE
jgi:two-component system nitrate/nitrite response regulator NarL